MNWVRHDQERDDPKKSSVHSLTPYGPHNDMALSRGRYKQNFASVRCSRGRRL